ncbi:MAG TPA: putative porin, partial [Acinetobacter pseudolwoffii]|nr:putative porin [Acinetobacter pseudolwoffii]
PGLLVALGLVGISEDNADDEIDPTLRAKYVTQVGQYDMNFEGGASFGDIDAYNLGADLYLDKTFSVGLGFSDSDLEGNDVFTIRAKKFFNQQVSLEGSINFADNADTFGVRGAYRF